ncbi:MAG: RNA-directed DNA polymerase, partial [Candidatus Paceibacterota bacterium]
KRKRKKRKRKKRKGGRKKEGEGEGEREREREREREPASPAHRIYCLKCDVSKYFASIDKNILFQILRRKIRDKDVLCLIWEIIKSNPKGIPIGNLTSQLFANVYLNELDQYVKRVLRKKYYIRYMDDFLILDTDKKHLHKIKEEIRVFLWDELKLTLHPKKAEVFPIDKGVDFLGYVLKNGKRYLRKDTVKRFMKKRRKYRAMIRNGKLEKNRLRDADASWKGYCKFADSHMLRKKLRI